MIGGVSGLISCIMCSVPFWIISHYGKESHTPLSFWSGDGTLKEKVNNIPAYNQEMAALYKKCAWAFLIAGICCLLYLPLGVILIMLECTVGIYVVYRKYKKILWRYS